MPAEALTNNISTQLSAAIGSTSATAITVASAAGFPSGQLLTATQSSFEAGTTGWAAISNCTIAQSAAQALDGTKSLGITASSAATVQAGTLTGASGIAVTAGALYSGYFYAQAATTGRSINAVINWYTSGGAFISQIFGAAVTDATGSWVQASVTGQAPSNAAFATLIIQVNSPANGEVHYLDVAWFAAGYVTQWRILIDSEIMIVTGGHGLTTWIVTRGAEGTTAATHLNNATVIQLLTAGALNNFGAQGVLAYAKVTASQGPTAPSFDITGLYVSATLVAGRRYRIYAQALITSSVASDAVQIAIVEDSTDVMLVNETSPGGVSGTNRAAVIRNCPLDVAAGSHSYKASARRNGGGTGNFTNNAGTSFPSYILIEDVGPVS